MNQTTEPTIEIPLTLAELRAVSKSLSIGCDQLARKLYKIGENVRTPDLVDEYALLMKAKQVCESVLVNAMR